MSDQDVFKLDVVVDETQVVQSSKSLNLLRTHRWSLWSQTVTYQLNAKLEACGQAVRIVWTLGHQTAQIGTECLLEQNKLDYEMSRRLLTSMRNSHEFALSLNEISFGNPEKCPDRWCNFRKATYPDTRPRAGWVLWARRFRVHKPWYSLSKTILFQE